jgi:ferredoxin
MSGSFQVEIDLDKCVGSRICVAIAPKAFQLNKDGQACVRRDTDEAIAAIRTAAEACPVSAISLREVGDG